MSEVDDNSHLYVNEYKKDHIPPFVEKLRLDETTTESQLVEIITQTTIVNISFTLSGTMIKFLPLGQFPFNQIFQKFWVGDWMKHIFHIFVPKFWVYLARLA